MKAIVTKYIGPTDSRGSRIKVSAEGLRSIFVYWDDVLHTDENHTQAAKQFALKMHWYGTWFGGGLPDSTGYCYVRVDYPGLDRQLIDKRTEFYIAPEDTNDD